jgi:PAS domain S-box-containing protein
MTSSALRVLLIDDEEADFLVTKALLEQLDDPAPELDWASTFDEGLDLLVQRRHDVCLLDYFLQERTGLELLRQARSLAIRTPIILLTGKGSREVDIQAMKSGAVDYLVKGSRDPEALERSLRYAVERHRAQEALRQSEERHRAMFDHLPLGVYRVTEEGEYIEANPTLIRTLEFPPREVLGRMHARNYFVAPRDRERFLAALRDHGVVLGFESEIRTARSRAIRVRNTARAHRGPAGVIEYVEGTVEDVSSERPTRKTEGEAAGFRAIRDSDSIGIAVADAQGRVLDANRVLLETLGVADREAHEDVLWDLFPSEESVAIAEAVDALARGDAEAISRRARITTEVDGRLAQRTVEVTLLLLEVGDRGAESILVILQETGDGPAA